MGIVPKQCELIEERLHLERICPHSQIHQLHRWREKNTQRIQILGGIIIQGYLCTTAEHRTVIKITQLCFRCRHVCMKEGTMDCLRETELNPCGDPFVDPTRCENPTKLASVSTGSCCSQQPLSSLLPHRVTVKIWFQPYSHPTG